MPAVQAKKADEFIDDVNELTGIQKAAILLISFGTEQASEILMELSDNDVEKITLAIAAMRNISPEVVEGVRGEFYEMIKENEVILEGGRDYARDILTKSLGEGRADELMKKYEYDQGMDAFGIFQSAETSNIVHFLQSEHPQVAAVILAHIKIDKAAEVLSALPDDFQGDVAYRMARMGKISAEVVEEIEAIIKDQMSAEYSDREDINKGSSAVAGILNEADIATERRVLTNLEDIDPEIAEEIKQQMFLFEDIIELDDRTMQVVISSLNKQDMVMGLKGVDEEIKDKFLDNMSQRAQEILIDDLEALGPVHVKQVEEAQQSIVHEIKQLEEEGKISLRKNSQDNIIE